MSNQARIADIKAKIAGRTDSEGNPRLGYKANVAALKVELSRLEKAAKPAA